MYCYFCIGFIDFMVAGKKLTDYTNLFSPYDFSDFNDLMIPPYDLSATTGGISII